MVNVVLNSDAGVKGVKVEGSDAFVQRVQADIEMLRSSPNGQQMLAEFDKAAAEGNVVTIRELQNVDNGYAQSVGGSDISNGRAGTSGPVDISYNPAFAIPELPVPAVTLFHEMSHAYNGVNGTFLPGTYNGPGADKGQVPECRAPGRRPRHHGQALRLRRRFRPDHPQPDAADRERAARGNGTGIAPELRDLKRGQRTGKGGTGKGRTAASNGRRFLWRSWRITRRSAPWARWILRITQSRPRGAPTKKGPATCGAFVIVRRARYSSGTSSSATMLMILISGLIAGPAVSL